MGHIRRYGYGYWNCYARVGMGSRSFYLDGSIEETKEKFLQVWRMNKSILGSSKFKGSPILGRRSQVQPAIRVFNHCFDNQLKMLTLSIMPIMSSPSIGTSHVLHSINQFLYS